MKDKYKHLFFDLDHTIWDFDKNSEETLRILYHDHNLAAKGIEDFDAFQATYSVHNNRLWERFRNGYIKREELRWKRMWLTLLDHKVADTALAHKISTDYLMILPTQTRLTPFAKEVLDSCEERYQMHLITNGFETTQWQKLEHSGIAHYFKNVITSEKSNSLKPHPEIFAYSLKTTGASAPESLMLGDALHIDILGASKAGWDQLYYNPQRIEHNEKPTYEIACWSEVIDKL